MVKNLGFLKISFQYVLASIFKNMQDFPNWDKSNILDDERLTPRHGSQITKEDDQAYS